MTKENPSMLLRINFAKEKTLFR